MRAAARLIGRIARFGHVSDYMRDVLHWLPFPLRITYRISALVWRCLTGVAPVYLQELCSTLSVQRRGSLRSSKQLELLAPRSRTSIMQGRAFSVAGPAIWNELPVDLRLMHIEPLRPHSSLTSRLFSLAGVESGALL